MCFITVGQNQLVAPHFPVFSPCISLTTVHILEISNANVKNYFATCGCQAVVTEVRLEHFTTNLGAS